jgi:hypothetical protein
MPDPGDDLWEELEQRWDELEPTSDKPDGEKEDSPKSTSPWAKTSSGDADSVTTD